MLTLYKRHTKECAETRSGDGAVETVAEFARIGGIGDAYAPSTPRVPSVSTGSSVRQAVR
jgi:hypothetical protein